MRPGKVLLGLLLAWCGLALLIAFLKVVGVAADNLRPAWMISGATLALLALIDAMRPGSLRKLDIERELAQSLALGVDTKAKVHVSNTLDRKLYITLAEPPCKKLIFKGFPVRLTLQPNEQATVSYQVLPIERGEASLPGFIARVDSPWQLWQHRIYLASKTEVKIYPNFSPISQIAQLGIEQHVRKLGVHLAQRRGDGMEFKQLREFVEGDALRQIDWKTTARYRRPISREYQDERNQDVFFLLDCGRRLRHKDGDLSHFDHALNAILLTAYIAIHQGDSAGFCSFAGAERWLNPVQGHRGVTELLSVLYDLQSSVENSDFLQVAEDFIKRHRRRSLVIIVSNVRVEDREDLLKAMQLLSKHHVVLVTSMRERLMDEILNKPVATFQDALQYSATHMLLTERTRLMQNLNSHGVVAIDTLPEMLHVHLVNQYFKLKRSRRL